MPESVFLSARCNSCGASSDRVTASLAGRRVRCPGCSARFEAPAAAPAPTAAEGGAVAPTLPEAEEVRPTVAEEGALAPTRAEGAFPEAAPPGGWQPGDSDVNNLSFDYAAFMASSAKVAGYEGDRYEFVGPTATWATRRRWTAAGSGARRPLGATRAWPSSTASRYVRIIDGELESGTIDKKAIGAFDGQIVHRVIRQYGMKRAADFIDDITHLAIRSIMLDGFSFGIDDEDVSRTEYGQIDEVLSNAVLDVQRRINIYEDGQLEPMPGRTPDETLEMQIMQVLGKARDRTGEIAGRHLGLGNSAVVMAVSGARGSMLNLTQMAGCVGQQSVRGERIMRGYDARTSLTVLFTGKGGATVLKIKIQTRPDRKGLFAAFVALDSILSQPHFLSCYR